MYLLLRILQNVHGYLQLGDSDRGAKATICDPNNEPESSRYIIEVAAVSIFKPDCFSTQPIQAEAFIVVVR